MQWIDRVKWVRRLAHRMVYRYLSARGGQVRLSGIEPPTYVRLVPTTKARESGPVESGW